MLRHEIPKEEQAGLLQKLCKIAQQKHFRNFDT